MNCFRLIIFAKAKTTFKWFVLVGSLLWIAFDWLSLQRQKQQDADKWFSYVCCELLSIDYLCKGKNNIKIQKNGLCSVVNCFRLIIFAKAKTTSRIRLMQCKELWIAFDWLSLQRQKQPQALQVCVAWVVNCFRLIIFAKAKTTSTSALYTKSSLWIAFDWLSLQRQKQPWNYGK